jgi:hypothetical protein
MERVYLLLRNNQQTGPFTIGELLQQQLRPSDMIWIEGKSTAWTYLSELELIPFIKQPETPKQNEPIKTNDEIERKAEELRQKILASAPKAHLLNYPVEIETYSSPYKLPEDDIQFVDHRKERRIRKSTAIGELFLTCFVIGLFMLGIYKGKSFLGARHKVQNSVATQLNTRDEHAAQKDHPAKQVNIPVVDTIRQYDSLLTLQKTKQKILTNKKAMDSTIVNRLPLVSDATIQSAKKEVVQPPLEISKESSLKKEDTPVKKEIVPLVPEIKTNSEPEKEEKKGFLRGLFKKKKKEDSSTAKEK